MRALGVCGSASLGSAPYSGECSMRRFIHEIHRRSLWQVLGVYLLGSWFGYEVVLALTDGVGLPS